MPGTPLRAYLEEHKDTLGWHDSDERTPVDVLLSGAATPANLWGRLAAG